MTRRLNWIVETKIHEIAKKYIPCTCGEIYHSRNLVAPDCEFHNEHWNEFAQELCSLAFEAGEETGKTIGQYESQGIYELESVEVQTKQQFLDSLFKEQ